MQRFWIVSKQRIDSETVEKVFKHILWRDVEKNDLTECATINDLTITWGHETPKNHPVTILKGFSTVSADTVLRSYRSDADDPWGEGGKIGAT
jgi:hypothetical protein